jgi:hypothetical protein
MSSVRAWARTLRGGALSAQAWFVGSTKTRVAPRATAFETGALSAKPQS